MSGHLLWSHVSGDGDLFSSGGNLAEIKKEINSKPATQTYIISFALSMDSALVLINKNKLKCKAIFTWGGMCDNSANTISH